MLMTPSGQVWGMVSGGCLEHDILDQGRRALLSKQSRVVRYDSSSDDDVVFGTGLGCNGVIDVLIEPVTERLRDFLIYAVETCSNLRRPVTFATVIEGTLTPGSDPHLILTDGGWLGNDALLPLVDGSLSRTDEPVLLSGEVNGTLTRLFVQFLSPPIQLVAFGGWLDVIPLMRMAREMGWQVVVVDSRQRQSSWRLFREANAVLLCAPNEALTRIQFDDRTVAVLMNHHFESDQEALSALTQISTPFLGMLGPKRRRERILERVREMGGVISDEFARHIHGPVGLDIGAETPEEIALSIVAEILAVLNHRNAKSVCERSLPLHVAEPEVTSV